MPAELYHFSSLSVLKSIIFNVDLSEFVTRFSFHFYGRVMAGSGPLSVLK